jgi:hypothetical protein
LLAIAQPLLPRALIMSRDDVGPADAAATSSKLVLPIGFRRLVSSALAVEGLPHTLQHIACQALRSAATIWCAADMIQDGALLR